MTIVNTTQTDFDSENTTQHGFDGDETDFHEEFDSDGLFDFSFNAPEIFFFVLVGFLAAAGLVWCLVGIKDILQEQLEERRRKKRDAEYREATESVEATVKMNVSQPKRKDAQGNQTEDDEMKDHSAYESTLKNVGPRKNGGTKKFQNIDVQRIIARPQSSSARVFGGPPSALSRNRVTPSPLGESLSVYPSVMNTPIPTEDDVFSRNLPRLSSATGNSWRAFGHRIDEHDHQGTKNDLNPGVLQLPLRNKILPPLRRDLS